MTVGESVGVVVVGVVGAGLLATVVQWMKRHTALSSDGDVVPSDVQALADREGVSADVYALARVGASEAGGQTRAAKAGVMWVCINEANRRGVSVLHVVIGSAQTFGHQGETGRSFVASARDPQTIDLDVAAGVVDGSISDPTWGALNFDSPRSYTDKIDAAGNVVLTKAERIAAFEANRASEGKSLVTLEGVPATTFRFWRIA